MTNCVFCDSNGGEIIFKNDLYRVVLVNDNFYPGFLRVIINNHLKELTDLSDKDNLEVYAAVLNLEKIVRKTMNPDKINLASFGNMTPHVHWHIIPRFENDLHFPNPIWGDVVNKEYIPLSIQKTREVELVKNIKESFS